MVRTDACSACSPIVTDGLAIAALGSESSGGIVAYDLASGDQKWKWTGDGAAYASPVVLTVDGTKMVLTLTAKKIVGLSVADGKLLCTPPGWYAEKAGIPGRSFCARGRIPAGASSSILPLPLPSSSACQRRE